LIRPERPVTARAASIHGLTNEFLADQPAWTELADEVRAFLGQDWICARNAHVDYRELSRHLLKWEPARVIDTLRLAKATYKGLPSRTLDGLLKHVGPDLRSSPRRFRPASPAPPNRKRSQH
jgi:exodeoxyribonuclease X